MADDTKKTPPPKAGPPKATDGSQRFEVAQKPIDAPPKAPVHNDATAAAVVGPHVQGAPTTTDMNDPSRIAQIKADKEGAEARAPMRGGAATTPLPDPPPQKAPPAPEKDRQAEIERPKVEAGNVGIVGPDLVPGTPPPRQSQAAVGIPIPVTASYEPELAAHEPDLTNMNASINTITAVAAKLITRETASIKAALSNRTPAEAHASVERINAIAAKLIAVGASLRPVVAPMTEAEALSKLRP